LKQSAAVILLYCGLRLDEQSPALVFDIYLKQKARMQFRADEYKNPTIGNNCTLRARPFTHPGFQNDEPEILSNLAL